MSIIPVTVPTGAIRYNTDSNKMECFNGTKWMQVSVSSPDLNGGPRGFNIGGYNPAYTNIIDYVTIATTGNATDFGDLFTTVYSIAGCSASHTRGMVNGGYAPSPGAYINTIQFITFASTGNAEDWGDMANARGGYLGGTSDSHGGLE